MIIFTYLIFNLWARVFLAPDSHCIKIDFTAKKGTEGIILSFIYKGKEYLVMRRPNFYPEREWRDSIFWYSRDKWDGGDLRLTAVRGYEKEEVFIPERNIAIRDFGVKGEREELPPTPSSLPLPNKEGDIYAWRMVGYDPQNTGFYPFSLYPPVEFKWLYNWSNFWAPMYSGCAAYGMLFVPDRTNYLLAFDLETGRLIWRRETTSNTMTCALCVGDSILFVGCVIGFNPDYDTTFYALNPHNGELKWGKALRTVEFSPIAVDSFVYVPTFGRSRIFCFKLSGDSLWAFPTHIDAFSPVWWDGKLYHTGGDGNRVLYARNGISGDSIWTFTAPDEIWGSTITKNKVFFSVETPLRDTLYALDAQTGALILKVNLPRWAPQLTTFEDKLFVSYGYKTNDTILTYVQSLSLSGSLIWEKVLRPVKIDGGGSAYPLITKGGILWVVNTDKLYILDGNSSLLIEEKELPPTNTWEACWFFPIAYKGYIIGAHRDFIYVYKTDTIVANNGDTINFYTYQNSGDIFFFLFLPGEEKVSLELFDLSGRFLCSVYKGLLLKGRHLLSFNPGRLPSGVYFCLLKTSKVKKAVKIPWIRERRKK